MEMSLGACFTLSTELAEPSSTSEPHLEDGAQRLRVVVVDLERSLVVFHGRAYVPYAVAIELYVSTTM